MGKNNPFVSTSSEESRSGLPQFVSDWSGLDSFPMRNWTMQEFLYYSRRFLEQNGWYLVIGCIVLYNIYWYMDGLMKSMYQKRSLQIATSTERKAKYEDEIKRARQRQAEQLEKKQKENKLIKRKLMAEESNDNNNNSSNQNMHRNLTISTPTNIKISKEKKKKSPELTFRANRNEYNPLLGHGGGSGYRPKGFARPSVGG